VQSFLSQPGPQRRIVEEPDDGRRGGRGVGRRVQQAVAPVVDDLAQLLEVAGHDRLAQAHVLEELHRGPEEAGAVGIGNVR
jgi:hypothetical protein